MAAEHRLAYLEERFECGAMQAPSIRANMRQHYRRRAAGASTTRDAKVCQYDTGSDRCRSDEPSPSQATCCILLAKSRPEVGSGSGRPSLL
jgi:hypothetical protein